MFKQLKGQKGFTLIELMIVVAIIGILAAIAIPNFLQYQLKSKQAEAKTNLMAIKTSSVAWQAERGCYLAVQAWPLLAAPASAAKASPALWFPAGAGPVVTVPAAPGWCVTGGVSAGTFTDIGFQPTGNVMYQYAVGTYQFSHTSCAGPVLTPAVLITAEPGTTNFGVTAAGFRATATSNLDGDAAALWQSVWASADGTGAQDCTTGVF